MNIIRPGEGPHHNHILPFFLGHRFCLIGIEINLADGGAWGGVHTGGEQLAGALRLVLGLHVKLGVEQGIYLVGGNPHHGLFLRDQTLIGHIHRNLHCGIGGSLTVTGLEHPKLAALDGKFDILHFAVMVFELVVDLFKLCIGLRQVLTILAISSVLRMPATTSSPWAFIR